jgi:hypothetical protein
MTVSPAEARGVILAIPGPGQEAVMTASSERRVTGGILFLLAGLAALGALATKVPSASEHGDQYCGVVRSATTST